jgi:hypothetical protein
LCEDLGGSICDISVAEGENEADHPPMDQAKANQRVIPLLFNTAAASADLAEAVRAYRDATDKREEYEAEFRDMWDADKPHHEHKVAALLTVETNAYRAMLAALARLDSAASSGGGA